MAVHQWTYFCHNLCLLNKHANRRIAKYLASTSTYVDLLDRNQRLITRGVFYRTHIYKGIECYLDAYFSGGWDQVDSDNTKNAMPCT